MLQPASILPRSLAARYAVAIVTVGVAFVLALAFPVLLGALPLFTFVPAILITAAVSGFGPASLATLLATMAIEFVFLPNSDALQAQRLLVFDGYCLLLSGILATYRTELLRMRGEQIRNLELVATTTRELSQRLEEERARLQTIVSSVPGVVWEAWGEPDRNSQRIDFVSEHVTRMVGYSVEEWQGTPNFWLTIVHPDDQAMAAENAARHWSAGGAGTNAFRWITKDGRAIDVESHSTVIAGENGQAIGMRGVSLDVTARRRAEESLRVLGRVSDLLATSLDVHTTLRNAASMAVPILGDLCMIDLVEGDAIRRVAAHHADPEKQPLAERLLAYPPDAQAKHGSAEAIRTMKPVYGDRIPPELLDSLGLVSEHRQLAQAIGVESHMIVPMESRGRAVGAIHFSSPHIARYGENDRELAQLFARRVALAIDNAQLYQSAVEASRARDQFLATVSHELRTPMTATLGWVRMLAGGHLDEDTRVLALDAIERSTRAQAHLIEDILDVSSIVTGKFRLETGPVDLPAIIDNAVGTLMPAAEAKQIAIEIDSRDWVGVLQGDENRLQQVIWNLVSNAIKFGRRGGRIDVRLRRHEGLARLTVSDDGGGIEPEFLPHVFERFRQADASLTRMHGGLGLGLAIVRHLVELHGGTVRAESGGPDRGATFTIELPLATTDHVLPDIAASSALPRLDSRRVLVVDDEADARAIVAAILRSCGATVTTASNAGEALLALDQPHDLLITDIAMPDGDGFALMKTLRGRGATTKAIALTAIADAAHHPGAETFERILRKPIDPIDLARAVAKELGPTS